MTLQILLKLYRTLIPPPHMVLVLLRSGYASSCLKVTMNCLGCIKWLRVKIVFKTEVAKWGWLAVGVTILGIIMISLPQIPGRYKIAMAVPIYAAIVFVNYKYICLKKASRQEGEPMEGAPGQKPQSKSSGKGGSQPGKALSKKGR